MRDSIRKYALAIILVSWIFTSFFLWYGYGTYQKLNELKQLEEKVFNEHSLLEAELSELHRALGFGGFIHNIKLYLVHRRASQLDILEQNIIEVEKAYQSLRTLLSSDKTRRAIGTLDRFVSALRDKYELLKRPENRQLPAAQLDALLNIETPEILTALVTLESLTTRENQVAIREIKISIDDLTHRLILSSVLLPVLLIFGLVISWVLIQNQRSKKHLSKELLLKTELAALSNELIKPIMAVEEIAAKVLASARTLTGSEYGYVSEIDPESRQNICHTLSAMMGDSCQMDGPDACFVFPIGDDNEYASLWGHALNTGDAFYTNSPPQHPSSKGLPAGHVPIERFLSVPVKYDNEVVGQIALANSETDYSDEDLQNVQRLAEFYAMAIYRNRAKKERIKMEGQMRQSYKMEAIGTMAGGIAHDFNNLLAIISGNIDLMQIRQAGNADLEKPIGHVREATARARDLVNQILSFSRQEKALLVPINLASVVENTMQLMRSTIPASVEIRTTIADESIFVQGDATQLQQILINLSTNAVQAMEEKGLLQVSLGVFDLAERKLPSTRDFLPGEYALLAVQDNGPGMDEEILTRIFDPFFTTKTLGTGMGLSVIHGLIDQHGGFINVESVVGEGTTFEVLIPTTRAKAELIESEEKDLLTGQANILFVDDEESVALICSELLVELGYTVTTKTNSVEALELFKENPQAFDLVFTDQTMPEMTGMEFAKELMKVRPDIPIVLCSGYNTRVSEQDVLDQGLRAYCMKPMSVEELARAASEALEKPVG